MAGPCSAPYYRFDDTSEYPPLMTTPSMRGFPAACPPTASCWRREHHLLYKPPAAAQSPGNADAADESFSTTASRQGTSSGPDVAGDGSDPGKPASIPSVSWSDTSPPKRLTTSPSYLAAERSTLDDELTVEGEEEFSELALLDRYHSEVEPDDGADADADSSLEGITPGSKKPMSGLSSADSPVPEWFLSPLMAEWVHDLISAGDSANGQLGVRRMAKILKRGKSDTVGTADTGDPVAGYRDLMPAPSVTSQDRKTTGFQSRSSGGMPSVPLARPAPIRSPVRQQPSRHPPPPPPAHSSVPLHRVGPSNYTQSNYSYPATQPLRPLAQHSPPPFVKPGTRKLSSAGEQAATTPSRAPSGQSACSQAGGDRSAAFQSLLAYQSLVLYLQRVSLFQQQYIQNLLVYSHQLELEVSCIRSMLQTGNLVYKPPGTEEATPSTTKVASFPTAPRADV